MSKKLMTASYSDNDVYGVGERLAAEIERDPKRLDVASGYFAASLWSVIGKQLDQVEKFRLLLGKDHELNELSTSEESANVEDLVQLAIAGESQPSGLVSKSDAEKVAGLISFLESQAEKSDDEIVRLWQGEGFLHAKAYILDESVGIGSANFTYRGLRSNRELVGWRQDRSAVDEVREWFEKFWADQNSIEYTDELIDALKATPLVSDEYRPYDVLIRTLAARYGSDQPPSLESANFQLKWFQEDAVRRVVKLLEGPARGALLADAVGLGKTFVALGVIHHYLYGPTEQRRGKGRPVLILAPASLQKMWERELDKQGLRWACEFATLQSLRDDFDPERLEGADLIVIDEAHRLRGGGTWYRKALDLLRRGKDYQLKRVLLLTATPVNTQMDDLVKMLQLMTKNHRAAWAPDVADFERYLKQVDKGEADPFPLLDRSLVRRSRKDILEAQEQAKSTSVQLSGGVKLPGRETVHIDYDYGTEDDEYFATFSRRLRGLHLAPYDLDSYKLATTGQLTEAVLPLIDDSDESLMDNRTEFAPGTIAALFAAGLLTRFQSSIVAIKKSLDRLRIVLERCDQALTEQPPRIVDLGDEKTIKRLISDERDGDDDSLGDLDERWKDALADSEVIDPDVYDIGKIREAISRDLKTVAELKDMIPAEENDGKIDALIDALTRARKETKVGTPGLGEIKQLLIFTQYKDTARYIAARLTKPELADVVGRVELVDGDTSPERRAELTSYFDPAGTSALDDHAAAEKPPRILVSTDVLAEGHNLQLAQAIVNFDLHFNPQVAVQRAGRVDRLNSPHDKVWLVSMLPPDDLEEHMRLLWRLDQRFRRVHGLGLGDEQVMPIQGDAQGKTLEQMRRLYKDDETVLDEIEASWVFGSTDFMRQALSAFLVKSGQKELEKIPYGVSSVRKAPIDWNLGEGVFLALAAPATIGNDRETYWRFYPKIGDEYGDPISDDLVTFQAIAASEQTDRAEMPDPPAGPGVFDWELIQHAATQLANEITLTRNTAAIHRGASAKSNKVHSKLVSNLIEVDGRDELLERLEQVPVEDFDGEEGYKSFNQAIKQLVDAQETEASDELLEQLSIEVVDAGLELFGEPEIEDGEDLPSTEVKPADIRLVAYEVILAPDQVSTAAPAQSALPV